MTIRYFRRMPWADWAGIAAGSIATGMLVALAVMHMVTWWAVLIMGLCTIAAITIFFIQDDADDLADLQADAAAAAEELTGEARAAWNSVMAAAQRAVSQPPPPPQPQP